MSRIAGTFERLRAQGRKALIPFIAAGDPAAEATVPLMIALVRGGADIIELGVPFSDPMADGPPIQRAAQRAIEGGTSLRRVLEMVSAFRGSDPATPVVLMGYANPIEAMGVDAFVRHAAEAGVDGVLVVDYPPEESAEFARALRRANIDPIFLLAPTSTAARVAMVARAGAGYIYYVSLKGVTGAANADLDEVARRLPEIRNAVGLPVGVGFGIRDAAGARRAADAADAVIIGSRLIEELEGAPHDELPARAQSFVAKIRRAMDAPASSEGEAS